MEKVKLIFANVSVNADKRFSPDYTDSNKVIVCVDVINNDVRIFDAVGCEDIEQYAERCLRDSFRLCNYKHRIVKRIDNVFFYKLSSK